MRRLVRIARFSVGFSLRLSALFMLCLAACLALFVAPARAAGSETADAAATIPPGFNVVSQAPGVTLYKKNYPNGAPDWVQVIRLDQGASIEVLHAGIAGPGTDKGVYGGDNPKFYRRSLDWYWDHLADESANLFCVTNGQFFYMPEYPGPIPFPLKVDGQLITDGYGIADFPGNKLILELWEGRADIRELTPENLHGSTAPNIVAGLTEEANKRAKQAVGRTFMGILDENGDGAFETMLILNTSTATQPNAAEVLRSFGAGKVMMLDGGGSTQLRCGGDYPIYSERLIPQALAILSAPAAGVQAAHDAPAAGASVQPAAEASALPGDQVEAASDVPANQQSAQVVSAEGGQVSISSFSAGIEGIPHWPVLVQGEGFEAAIQAHNRGTAAWQIGGVQLQIEKVNWDQAELLPLGAETAPGATAGFTWSAPAWPNPGIYPLRLNILSADGQTAGPGVEAMVIVIPVELADRRDDLAARLDNWAAEQPDAVPSLAEAWIHAQLLERAAEVKPQAASLAALPGASLTDLAIFPLAALFLGGVIFHNIRKRAQQQIRQYRSY